MTAKPLQARRGFSRYELLTVVGIIGVLLFGLSVAARRREGEEDR